MPSFFRGVGKSIRSTGKKASTQAKNLSSQATKKFTQITSPEASFIIDNISQQRTTQQDSFEAQRLGQLADAELEKLTGKKLKKNYAQQFEEARYEEVQEEEKVDELKEEEIKKREEADEEARRAAQEQERLAQEEIKKTKEAQRLQREAARNLAADNPVGAVSIPIPTTTSSTQDDVAAKQAEQVEKTAEINQETEQKISDAKEDTNEKIEKIKAGPTGLLAIFLSPLFFYVAAFIDASISRAGVGDWISVIIFAIVWLIPCIILFDIITFVRILIYLIIDGIFGSFTSFSELLPILGSMADFILDFVPEVALMVTKSTPYEMLQDSYENKKGKLISFEREKLQRKIARLRDDGRDKIKNFVSGVRGRFSGVAGESRKFVVLLFIGAIIYFTQFLPFLGIESTSQIITLILLLTLILVARSFRMINSFELKGILFVLALNIAIKYIITYADSALSNLLGSNTSVIVIGFFVIGMVLLILHVLLPDQVSMGKVVGLLVLLLVILSMAYYVPYVTSEQFQQQIEQQQAETQAEIDTFNFWERAFNWYYEMQARGSGTYIAPADQENVHEFIGITMSEIQASRNEFLEGQPVQLNIQYATGSKVPISVLTTCDTLGQQSTVLPQERVPATELYTPVVRCVFEGLPKGTHTINVNAYYNYSSTIEIPLYFMTTTQQAAILDRGGDPESFIGSVDKPRTSSGPIDFGVSNEIGTDNPQLNLPIVFDKNNLNEFPKTIFLSLKNPEGSKTTQGDLRVITKIQFDLPEGLNIGNCDFAEPGIIEPTSRVDGRWKVDVTDRFETFKLNDIISCDIFMDESYKETYLPATGYSLSTMYFSIDYVYGLTQLAPVTVT